MDNVWTIKVSNETGSFTFRGLSVVSNVNYFSSWYFNVVRNRVIMISCDRRRSALIISNSE